MARIPPDFLNEVRGGHLSLLLLARVAELSKRPKEHQEEAYTQSLFEYASQKLGATSSTCYSRLRLLRVGGFLSEDAGVKKGKGIVGYTITPDGELLLKTLLNEAQTLVELCQQLVGNKNA